MSLARVTDHRNDPLILAGPLPLQPSPPLPAAVPHRPFPEFCEQDPGLTFSVQRSTHLSTDMFGMAAVTGKARERLSGLRKQPRKTALPSGEPEGKAVVRSRQENHF